MRQTKQRETVLEILRSADCHPTADWVYEQARKVIPNISLGTVYRNLNLLAEQNRALRFDHGHVSRYDGRTENHYHFVCTRCGKVCDVDVPINKRLNRKVASKTGFDVSSHRAVFFGRCDGCRSMKLKSRRKAVVVGTEEDERI
ncbi:MAG: transcriptional repressor [bacterium]